MQPFSLARVPEIVFGAGSLGKIAVSATSIAGLQAPVMVVADPALARFGVTARALDILAAAGHRANVYDGFSGEPKAADIDAAAALARSIGARAVVGLGGGSALDTAKLVASCAVSARPVEHYRLSLNPLPRDHLPIIAVATTAGTGSEVTRTSIFADADKRKVWAWGDELKPDVAILDPELTTGIPPNVTAMTGLDALVHAIESSTNRNRHAGNDLYCHRAIALISANLERAIAAPDDLAARAALLLGSCYAGIAIDNCGTALAHCISHAMADLAPVPHGRATGIAMLATIDWVAEGNREAFARVGKAMGVAEDAGAAVKAYERLVRATGMKISLAGDGFELNRPETLAEHMASPANAPMRNTTVRTVSDEDLLSLAQAVYAVA